MIKQSLISRIQEIEDDLKAGKFSEVSVNIGLLCVLSLEFWKKKSKAGKTTHKPQASHNGSLLFFFFLVLCFFFSQEQFISHLKELLSEIGHRSSNGCGAKPLSSVCNKDSNNVKLNPEPMETGTEINGSDIPYTQGSDGHEMEEANDSEGEPISSSEPEFRQSSCNNLNESTSSNGAERSQCLLDIKVSLTGEQ